MTPVFPARRAEEFDRLVEGTSTGPARDTRTTDLLELVTTMRAIEPVAPRPEFSASLREQLMEAADTLLVTDEALSRLTLPPRQRTRDRRVAALVGAAAVVGASASMAVAAQSALPGETLYPLKRILEDARTSAHLSDDARGISLLGHASDRLGEVTALLRTGDLGDGPTVASTLTTFSDQSLEAAELILGEYAESGDDATVEELRTFAAESLQTLAQLEAMLPEEAEDELKYAAEVLTEIDLAASQACPACRGGITQIPPVLASAGQISEPQLTVLVPAPVVDESTGDDTTEGGTGSATDGGQPATGGGTGGTLVPDDDPLPTGGGGATDPIEDLTDVLTGGSSTSTGGGAGGSTGGGTGGSTGGTGVDPLDDVLDEVDGTLGGATGGATGGLGSLND